MADPTRADRPLRDFRYLRGQNSSTTRQINQCGRDRLSRPSPNKAVPRSGRQRAKEGNGQPHHPRPRRRAQLGVLHPRQAPQSWGRTQSLFALARQTDWSAGRSLQKYRDGSFVGAPGQDRQRQPSHRRAAEALKTCRLSRRLTGRSRPCRPFRIEEGSSLRAAMSARASVGRRGASPASREAVPGDYRCRGVSAWASLVRRRKRAHRRESGRSRRAHRIRGNGRSGYVAFDRSAAVSRPSGGEGMPEDLGEADEPTRTAPPPSSAAGRQSQAWLCAFHVPRFLPGERHASGI
jgi:hypothetical protein